MENFCPKQDQMLYIPVCLLAGSEHIIILSHSNYQKKYFHCFTIMFFVGFW